MDDIGEEELRLAVSVQRSERTEAKKRAIAKEGLGALLGILSPRTKEFLTMLGVVFKRPELQDQVVAALAEEQARFTCDVQARLASLSDDISSKVDPLEVLEMLAQWDRVQERTASAEKRQMMRNVMLNGLTDEQRDRVEARIFLRALDDLDVASIAVLRRTGTDSLVSEAGALGVALIQPLVATGFVEAQQMSVGAAWNAAALSPVSVTHKITDLGRRFLAHLSAPDFTSPASRS